MYFVSHGDSETWYNHRTMSRDRPLKDEEDGVAEAKRSTFGDLMKVLLPGMALMAGLALAFRFFLAHNPRPENPSPVSVPAPVAPSVVLPASKPPPVAMPMASPAELLRKDVVRWSDSERSAHPGMFSWLGARGGAAGPWDWSEAARNEDPASWCREWGNVCGQREGELNVFSDNLRDRIVLLRKSLDEENVQLDASKRRVAALAAAIATNARPVVVEFETVEKGRLWGWNRRKAQVTLSDDASVERAVTDENDRQRRHEDSKRNLESAMAGAEASLKAAEAAVRSLAELRERAECATRRFAAAATDEERADVLGQFSGADTLFANTLELAVPEKEKK